MRARRRKRRARRGTQVWSSCSRPGKAEKRMDAESTPLWPEASSRPLARRADRETAGLRAPPAPLVAQGDGAAPSPRRPAQGRRERGDAAEMANGRKPGAAVEAGFPAPAAEGGPPYGPVVQQYLEIRAETPGALILFRVGSFYEAWFDEAELLARELGLKLSSRPSGGTAAAVAQAGFAHHALDGYLARLLQRGYRVAVVEEAEVAESPGMRQRAVARTLTPGTVTDAHLLPEDRPNYLCGVTRAGDTIGLAWTDVSTGEFHAGEYDADTAAGELARIAPAEVLAPVGIEWPEPVRRILPEYAQTPAAGRLADASAAREALADAYAAASPLDDLPVAQHAAGMVLGYLRALKGQTAAVAEGLNAPSVAGGAALRLDPATRRHLELTQTSREGAYQG